MSEFGSALRRLAGLHGLTNRKTAVLLDLSEQSVSELMTGKREPSLSTVQKVAQTFEVDALAAQEGVRAILDQVADPERFDRVEKRIKGLRWTTDAKGNARLQRTKVTRLARRQ